MLAEESQWGPENGEATPVSEEHSSAPFVPPAGCPLGQRLGVLQRLLKRPTWRCHWRHRPLGVPGASGTRGCRDPGPCPHLSLSPHSVPGGGGGHPRTRSVGRSGWSPEGQRGQGEPQGSCWEPDGGLRPGHGLGRGPRGQEDTPGGPSLRPHRKPVGAPGLLQVSPPSAESRGPEGRPAAGHRTVFVDLAHILQQL